MEEEKEKIVLGLLKIKWVTKNEIMEILGMTERQVRKWVADMNNTLLDSNSCILSTAGKQGYHIPNPDDKKDMEIALACAKELKAKAISIFEHRKPIEQFLTAHNQNYVQQELF